MQAEITIKRRSRSHMAPEGFFFEVSLAGFDATGPGAGEIYDDRFHEIYYFWNFGDPYTFTAPQNLPTAHKNANVAYGPMASHTYRTAGNYMVSVLVVEPSSGKQTTATLIVAIGDPANLFGGTKTIFVSPTSSWGNAPVGATLLTSFDGAVSAVQGNDTVPKRIMLNRGESYTFAGVGLGDNPGKEWPSCHIVAGPGAGGSPVVLSTGGFFWWDNQTTGNGDNKDFIFQNIIFEGPFDSTTGAGEEIDFLATFSNPPNLLLLDGCSFDGFGHAVYNDAGASTNVQHRVTILNDCTIVNFSKWGFSDSDKTASIITGCSIGSHIDALVDSTANAGAPVRFGGKDRASVIHSSDFFGRQGWSSHGSYLATQACIRVNSEGYEGSKSNVQANSFESGFSTISFTRAGGEIAHAGNVVIEKNFMMGCYQTNHIIETVVGGSTIRNNVCVVPNTGRLATTNDPVAFVKVENPDGDATNRATPISIYNNTFINLLDLTNFVGSETAMTETIGGSNFTTFNAANNVIHQPNLSNPDTGDAPLESSQILWAPREKGYHTTTVPLQTQTATPSNIVASYAPLSGSAALGDAINDPVAYDDFYGNPRPQYPSRGALEIS